MSRSSLFLALGLFSLSGCKQLFGPEDAGQGGTANTGGTAAGAGGVGGSGASSSSGGNGGAGGGAAGGAGTGGAECNFVPATVPGGTCSGPPMEANPLDATLFTMGVTSQSLVTDQFLLEPCSGFGMGACGRFDEAQNGPDTVLRATPNGGTGYWADPALKPTPFLYKPMNGAFTVVASVRVHSAQSGEWPGQAINLGGLLARGTGASDACRPPWMKLEVGTLDSPSEWGFRSAWQGLTTPDDEPHQSDVAATDVVPTSFDNTSVWVDLALCRDSADGQLQRFYRLSSETSWNPVGASSVPLVAEMTGPMDVGLVAAAYNATAPDVVADFRYVAFHEYQKLCTCADGLPTSALPTQ